MMAEKVSLSNLGNLTLVKLPRLDYDYVRSTISDKIKKFISKYKQVDHDFNDYDLLVHLLKSGGIISGGFVVAQLLGGISNDVDVYFNDEDEFLNAFNMANSNTTIDICWYEHSPIELHDLSIVQMYYDGSDFYGTKQAVESMNTMISDIFIDRIIYPERTKNRLFKYNSRYGVRYKKEQIITFCAQYDFSEDFDELLKISI